MIENECNSISFVNDRIKNVKLIIMPTQLHDVTLRKKREKDRNIKTVLALNLRKTKRKRTNSS